MNQLLNRPHILSSQRNINKQILTFNYNDIPTIRDTSLSLNSKTRNESGKSKFNEFLQQISNGTQKNIEEMTEETLCVQTIFEYFGSYLCHKVWVNGELDTIMLSSALSYLSDIKTYAKLQFPSNALWHNEDWYSTIRKNVQAAISRRCIDKGELISDKAKPIGRKLLKEVNIALYRKSENYY